MTAFAFKYGPGGLHERPWIAVCWQCFGSGWLWQAALNEDWPETPHEPPGVGRVCCPRCLGTGRDPDQPTFQPPAVLAGKPETRHPTNERMPG